MEDGLGKKPAKESIWQLQIVCIYLASRGFAPKPPLGLRPSTPLGDFRPQTLCAHPDFRAWLHHCCMCPVVVA